MRYSIEQKNPRKTKAFLEVKPAKRKKKHCSKNFGDINHFPSHFHSNTLLLHYTLSKHKKRESKRDPILKRRDSKAQSSQPDQAAQSTHAK